MDSQPNDQETRLLRFARNKDFDGIKRLFEQADKDGSIRIDVDVPDMQESEFTAIHFAVLNGRLDIVSLLIARGADVGAMVDRLDTPLHFAACYNRLSILNLLLRQVHQGIDTLINHPNCLGATPLFIAVQGDHVEIARTLLEHGADTSIQHMGYGTPMHFATQYGNYDMVKMLHQFHADMHPSNDSGRTPLHEAALYGRLSIASFLLKHGSNVNAKDAAGSTPLMFLMMVHGSQQHQLNDRLLQLFLSHHADVNATNNDGCTALHSAANSGRLKAVQLLLERGADPIAADAEGQTALFFAKKNAHSAIIEELIRQHGRGRLRRSAQPRT